MRTSLFSLAAAALTLGVPAARAASPAPGAVTSDRIKLPSGPGSVRGLAAEPEVDPFYGQVKYEVPIDLPAGIGGLTPKLPITYSGVLGNGPLGIGWSLPSVRIERSTRLGQPHFDNTDELEISGIANGRLVAVGNGEYRVEGLGQAIRITRIGDGFEVRDGAGVTYRLGVSNEARHASGTLVHAWLVDDIENQAGERIRYRYVHDAGQVYLREVLWGPNEVFRAELVYADRPDTVVSYRDGFKVITQKRLAHLRAWAFGMERRAYHFKYDDQFVVSRLASVTSTGLGGAGQWPTTTFSYASSAAPAVEGISGIGSWRLNVSGTVLADVDADGAADLLQLDEAGHYLRRNENGTFAAPVAMTGNKLPLSTVQLMDLDGDAKLELVVDTGDGWNVWKPVQRQWVAAGTWPGTNNLALKDPTRTRFADLDGDGLVDAIKSDNDNLYVYRATRQGFLAPRILPKIGGAVLPTGTGRFADENGDGVDDYFDVGLDGYDVFLGRGDGTFEPATHVAYPWAGQIANRDDVHLADLNRDGVLDLIKIDLGDVVWYPGRPNGSFSAPVHVPSPEVHSNDVVVTLQDSNGNGSVDVVWSSSAGMWRLDLAGPTTAGMLVGVSNGLGLTTQFTYRSSHALAVDAARAGEPWQYFVPIAMPVPTQQIGALGAGETTRRVTYSVRDGVWDADERRFAGFLSSIVTTWGATPAETASVLTRYNLGLGDKRVLRGKPINEQIRDGTGKRLRLTFNTWEAATVAGLPDAPLLRVPELTVVQTRYEDGPVLRESKIEYQFDGVGRPVKTFNHGRLDLTGDETYNETVYGDDAVTGVRSRVVEEIVRTMTYNASGVGQPGELVSRVRHLYGDDNALLPVGVIGKGWERETWAYLAEGSAGRWVRRTRTDYDPHGNAITTINAGVTRQITYDALGLHPVEESLPVGGRTLVWRSDWDNVLGLPTAITDPNGIVNHMRYDALGRISGISTGAAPEHIVYAYDWSAPFPKTYSYEYDGASTDLTGFSGWTSAGKWRESVSVSNGRGETRYSAVRLADSQWIIADYRERDPNSRVTFVGEPIYASSADLAGRPSGMVGQTLVYDPLGRIVREELANGSKRIYTRSVFEELVQQDDLAPVRNILDGQGRIIRTTRAAETTDATYDPAGRITSFSVDGGRAQHVFRYDTLGNMVFANDPDIGPRTLRYDDRGLLVQTTNGANQSTTYVYDEANRLIERHGSDAAVFRYHYDAVRSQWDGENVASRLSWIEEPTGSVDLSYDAFGNTARLRRQIDSKVAEATSTFSPSGLLLRQQYDDGFDIAYKYDLAGRATAAGDLWTLVDQDAAGRVLEERFGNGVTQTSRRDTVGQVSGTKVVGAGGATLYDVDVDRLLWGGISHVVDRDSVGLDHTAAFSYDGSSRLTRAVLGQGASAFNFSYNYDGLENMVRRDVAAPSVVGVLAGEYRYAEHGAGPRQLTSIAGASSTLHSFAYDGAGRQIAQDGIALAYDGLDQLVRVDGLASGTVQHAYGYDGLRIKTIEPTGQTTYWFAGGLSERNGVREHQVAIGDRTIARVARAEVATAISHARALGMITTVLRLLPFAIGALLLLIGASRPRRRYARMFAALTAAATLLPGCSGGSVGQRQQAAWATRDVVYFHQTVSAGPTLFTNADGALLEERRYEPFGESLDAYRKTDTGYITEAVDFSNLDTNILNKQTDAATGWSYHGARWMAPETGRWLTPDPPVKAPDPQFMQEPWTLHPYQYVQQNPLLYWDPDGRDDGPVGQSSRRQQPDQLVFGQEAHAAIQAYYRAAHLQDQVFTDISVGGILKVVDHPDWLALGPLAQRPDIYNATTGEVYEIKSMWDWSYADATVKLYSEFMSQFGLPALLGSPLDPGVHGFTMTTTGRFVDFWSPAPGVILYAEVIPQRVPVPNPVPVEAEEGARAPIRPRIERAAKITGVVVGGVIAWKLGKAALGAAFCGPAAPGCAVLGLLF